jgi:predicted N-acyltransferase
VPERLRIEEDVERLPAAAWQQLASGHPALRLEVLRTLVATARIAMPLRIFMLQDESGIAAAALCEVISSHEPNSALDCLLFGRAVSLATRLGASSRPALLFRTPVGSECPLLVRPGAAAEQRRILSRLLDHIESHAASQSFGIAFMDILDHDQVLPAALDARRYLSTEIHPHARLQVEWQNFDGYLAQLQSQSPSSARNARRERNRNRDSGVSIRHLPCTTAVAEALYRFARDHYRHKNDTDPPIEIEFLSRLSAVLGEDFLAFEAVRHGRRVGMLGGVRSGSVGWIAWYGAEIDRPNDFTYANLAFYHLAEAASTLGLSTLLYGTHASEAKRRRGCQLLRSRLYYRPHRSLARILAASYFPFHRAWYRRKLR